MSASSMALQLLSTSAYEKSNSTTASSRVDSNRGTIPSDASVRAIGHYECRHECRRGAKSATLAGQKNETSGADPVRPGYFGSQGASRSARLLGQFRRAQE